MNRRIAVEFGVKRKTRVQMRVGSGPGEGSPAIFLCEVESPDIQHTLLYCDLRETNGSSNRVALLF
jgi:hypothetical protein